MQKVILIASIVAIFSGCASVGEYWDGYKRGTQLVNDHRNRSYGSSSPKANGVFKFTNGTTKTCYCTKQEFDNMWRQLVHSKNSPGIISKSWN